MSPAPMTSIVLFLLLSTSAAYTNAIVASIGPSRPSYALRQASSSRLNERLDDNAPVGDGTSSSSNDDDEAPFAQSLSQRIAEVEQSESSFVAGLQRRVQSVAKADAFDTAISGNGDSEEPVVVELPVVCLDALLPNQRLTGSTTDPTFCNFLRSLGLGGTFAMTSLNNRQRKIRRFGVVARIELVDVDNHGAEEEEGYSILSTPTAVSFSIVGTRRCEILGQGKDMKDRIGRWRRSYDPDGEESRLGWGDERFVDRSTDMNQESQPVSNSDETQWNTNQVGIIGEESDDSDASTDARAKATYLIPLIEQWISLASDQTTYDNVDVIAATRRKAGEPGLSVNAAALIRKVQQELGPMPPPDRPTAFAVWGAALINPLPPLGVATEVRGAVLEADGAEKKLGILERGLIKSINNLDGTRPLNM